MTASPRPSRARLAAQRLFRRLEPVLARGGAHSAREIDRARPHVLRLEAPASHDPRPRWGHGRAPHAAIDRLLAVHHDRYRAELEQIVAYQDDLANITARAGAPGEPCWLNAWLPGLDTAALYAYIRRFKPLQYVEVGSGQSTLVVARAVADGGLDTKITSIDPEPRADVDAVCDRIIREPLEVADLSVFAELHSGDVVFFDGSHRVFTGSDVVVFYLDVLPSLPDGVIVGVHDILWPDDYLPEWTDYWFSEQYILAAYLLGGTPWLEPRLALAYAAGQPDLAAICEPLWRSSELALVDRRGFGFWSQIRRDRGPG